jgi:hypothetical protein
MEGGRRVRLSTYPQSVSRLSRQCGIFNTSQLYKLPRPVTEIALLLLTQSVEHQESLRDHLTVSAFVSPPNDLVFYGVRVVSKESCRLDFLYFYFIMFHLTYNILGTLEIPKGSNLLGCNSASLMLS